MKPDQLLSEFESLCEQAGYRIRKERGSFRGDSCVMEGDRLIVVNRNRPVESQILTMAKVLKELPLEEVYIKPAVRKKLVEYWDRMKEAR